jgi:hypothetical protein
MINTAFIFPVIFVILIFLYILFKYRKTPNIDIPQPIPAEGLEIPTRLLYKGSNNSLLRFFLYEDSIEFKTIFGNYRYSLSDIEIVCDGTSELLPSFRATYGISNEIFFKLKGKPFFRSFKRTQANFGNTENLKKLLIFLDNKKVPLSSELKVLI